MTHHEISAVPSAQVPPGVTLVDVREENEFLAGHATGALNVPMSTLRDRVDELPKEGIIYLICRSGARSKASGEFLAEHGYDVVNVSDGTLGWQQSGREMEAADGADPQVIAPTNAPKAV